ncbi:junctional adhesion molecule A-like [Dermacentor silvarum]|uniref:junctional adhesion molecule A-like n=1 Tax=Dermacentor silvarum TaxID=543639 RepID=UPI002100FC3C|nr:junctional adhesion molecule A-like [Dermacentor silvarum]
MHTFGILLPTLICCHVIAETSAKLIEPPKLQPLALPRNPAPNKKLVLSCVAVEGDPPLEFAWTKDGVPEREGRRRYSTAVLASHISSLTILELTAQDVGNYTCRVSNSAGADSSTASLVVQGQCIHRSSGRLTIGSHLSILT